MMTRERAIALLFIFACLAWAPSARASSRDFYEGIDSERPVHFAFARLADPASKESSVQF